MLAKELKLQRLKIFPNSTWYDLSNCDLISLNLPNVKELDCSDNPLKSFKLSYWRLYSIFLKEILRIRVINNSYRIGIKKRVNLLKERNLEVLYSPDNFTKPWLKQREGNW